MATATIGRNSTTEVICQSLLPTSEFINCFLQAKFMYNYKTALLQFFTNAYLDIEKDVFSIPHEDIWRFADIINEELEIYLSSSTDLAIFNAFVKEESIDKENIFNKLVKIKSKSGIEHNDNGQPIFIVCLFGKHSLKRLLEEFVLKDVLN